MGSSAGCGRAVLDGDTWPGGLSFGRGRGAQRRALVDVMVAHDCLVVRGRTGDEIVRKRWPRVSPSVCDAVLAACRRRVSWRRRVITADSRLLSAIRTGRSLCPTTGIAPYHLICRAPRFPDSSQLSQLCTVPFSCRTLAWQDTCYVGTAGKELMLVFRNLLLCEEFSQVRRQLQAL